MKLATAQQCFQLWDKYKMPKNIRQHSLQVAKVADAVAQHIKNQGYKVNLDLVNRGALLHDIAKILSIKGKTEYSHGQMGAKIILDEGHGKELANIVLYHILDKFSFNLTLEQQIVGYADRRVNHHKIVSVKERAKYLKQRYPHSQGAIKEKTPLFFEFERRYNLKKLALCANLQKA